MKPALWIALFSLTACAGSVGIDDAVTPVETGTTSGTTSGSGWGPGGGGGDGTETTYTEEDEAFREVWGELEMPGGEPEEGAWGFFNFDPDNGGVVCEFEGEILDATATDCPDCEFAWEVRLGQVEILEESGAGCAGVPELAWAGTSVRFGHSDPDTLYADFGSGWERAGYSEREESSWFFEIGEED